MLIRENTLFADRYRLIRQLGQGGFSEVWLADDSRTGIMVAVKIYAPGRGLDEDGVRLFSQEFSLVFNLNHTNLLKPTHYDVYDKMPYLVMPYCERGACSRVVGEMSEEDLWRFLEHVASGLAYLHAPEPPIIHQDIKPDNVLIDSAGNYLITDFGISTKARSTLRKSAMQKEVSGGGTLSYMGPERFSRDSTPVKASDVWSLGATLFELMTGYAPFGEHGGLLLKGGADIPEIPGNWSKDLKKIVGLCLQKETWDRPTADMLRCWAEKHRNGHSISFKTGTVKIPHLGKMAACVGGIVTLIFIIWLVYSGQESVPVDMTQQNQCKELVLRGDSLAMTGEASYRAAVKSYQQAIEVIRQHKLPEVAGVYNKKARLEFTMDSLVTEYVKHSDRFSELYSDNGYKQAIRFLERALEIKEDTDIRIKLDDLNEEYSLFQMLKN